LLIEILKRTPYWVFALFFVLLAAGYSQRKDRVVSRGKVSILPIAMIVLSFYGVVSAFGIALIASICWLVGIGVAVWVGVAVAIPRGVSFSTETQTYFVPGSWLPLVFMMAIFFIKYAVGVILARHLPIAIEPSFIGSISLCYGLFGGVFFAWALVMRRSASKA
jgi:uncharacterized protein DUF6622